MEKILVTRIACLGLAGYIFREPIYREKPRAIPSLTLTYEKSSRSTNHPCIHLQNGKIRLPLEVVHNERISRKLSDPIDFQPKCLVCTQDIHTKQIK